MGRIIVKYVNSNG